jgi:hypothetical protein
MTMIRIVTRLIALLQSGIGAPPVHPRHRRRSNFPIPCTPGAGTPLATRPRHPQCLASSVIRAVVSAAATAVVVATGTAAAVRAPRLDLLGD